MNEKGYKIMYDYNVLSAGKFATLREGSADVTRLYAEVERAKEALKQAKADTADAIIKVLADNPTSYLTCGDLAAVTGLSTAAISQMMCGRPDVIMERIPVRKRMVEMDENGNVMPWTERVEEYQRTGYRYCATRDTHRSRW
jgi:hypothetical protein